MRQYVVSLKTNMGKKHGTLSFDCDTGEGFLNMMANKIPLSGQMGENGQCHLRGELITLMRRIPFIADGIADENAIELTLRGERDTFTLSGWCSQGGNGEE